MPFNSPKAVPEWPTAKDRVVAKELATGDESAPVFAIPHS